jgi:O6-methylguanine-DNA--protein-cysteine methyltransferase
MLSHFFLESPIGTLTLVKTGGVLSGLYTGHRRVEDLGPRTHSGFEDVVEQLEEYFARQRTTFIVPCHRVIGSNGTLVGYGGGLERKRFLLDLEGGTMRMKMELESEPCASVRVRVTRHP